MPELSPEEVLRYSRHLIMPEVGLAGQRKLKASSVLLVGAGGLGSPAALYLAAAGIGRIGIVDFDRVDLTNLQRQVIHTTNDIGISKLQSAKEKIQAINPHVQIETYEVALDAGNALSIIERYDVVADGTDNFPTRYLINDACVLLDKPNAYGSIFRFEGQATVFHHRGGPCYRCLYPEPPPPGTVPSCAEGGVLGVLPGVIGTIQATEAIKIILGEGEPLVGRLLLYDALRMRFQELRIERDRNCRVCGDHPTITGLINYHSFCGVQATGEAILPPEWEIEPVELGRMLRDGDAPLLLDVREPHEFEINRIEGSVLIPLCDLDERANELDRRKEIVVYCLVGNRSAQACAMLRRAGFDHAKSLRGGIRAWIEEVEPHLTRY